MDSPRIAYTSRPDTNPQAELSALANVYRFIFDCHAKRKTAESAPELDSRDDTRKGKDAHTAAPRVPQK